MRWGEAGKADLGTLLETGLATACRMLCLARSRVAGAPACMLAHSHAVGCQRQRLSGTHLVVDVGIRACMVAQKQPATKVGGLRLQWLHAPRDVQTNKQYLQK